MFHRTKLVLQLEIYQYLQLCLRKCQFFEVPAKISSISEPSFPMRWCAPFHYGYVSIFLNHIFTINILNVWFFRQFSHLLFTFLKYYHLPNCFYNLYRTQNFSLILRNCTRCKTLMVFHRVAFTSWKGLGSISFSLDWKCWHSILNFWKRSSFVFIYTF